MARRPAPHSPGAARARGREPGPAERAGSRAGSDSDPGTHRLALELVHEGVLVTDARGSVSYLNPAAEHLTGHAAAQAHGRRLSEVLVLVDERTRQRIPDPVAQCLRRGERVKLPAGTLLMQHESQHEFCVEGTLTPVRSDSKIGGFIVTIRDVTELQGLNRLVAFQATHDPLTGLLNRRELESRVRGRLEGQSGRNALCYLDLDQFSAINSAGSHRAGDQLLRQVARQLAARIRRSDTLARIEADRFGLLLESCSLESAADIADGLREAVRELRFPWEDRVFQVSASVGVVPLSTEMGNFADIMGAAAEACETAKARGGNRVQIYRTQDAPLERHRNLTWWMDQVQRALDDERFKLHAHEIRPLGERRGSVPHVEFLVRMVDPGGELVAPETFLAAAETYNLMPAVDRWVVRRAIEILARTPEKLDRYGLCAVNLSGQSLSDPDFLEYVTDRLRDCPAAAERIVFEITETAVIADLDSAYRFIEALERLGCHFALDDFGSGVSSFGYLKNLPVDYLKIDGSFVRGMAADAADRAMVESINQIGHALGMRTIAEFVEDHRTLEMLEPIGVDYAQGSAVGEPWAVD